MGERAKLRYHGKVYYDEDFVLIVKKELNQKGLKYLGYKQDRKNHILLGIGYRTNKNNPETISIPYRFLDTCEFGKSLSDLIVDGVAYDKGALKKIGQEVASIWGASCVKYHIDKKNKVVIYDCIEHGEEFVTELKFSELKKYLYLYL